MLALLRSRPVLIGVVHLLATPGSPRFSGDREAIVRRATPRKEKRAIEGR
jgi:predicted TIM-barrel enzyme